MQVENETNGQLEALIRERIRRQGPIPFAEYMRLCLYHPEYGYYMTPRRRIGKQGDFFTSSSVHFLFGRLIARQLVQLWELLGGGAMTIAEQGAGEGYLALDILDALREEAADCYHSLTYALVEVSPEHRARQQERLAGHAARLVWCEPGELAGMTGCILSNELVDAFPVHLVEKRDGLLREIHVGLDGETLVEVVAEPSIGRLQEHVDWLGCGPVEGNRGEINLEAVDWMRQVARLLGRGMVLTIDYGYPAAELYAPHRRAGTLLCYHRHRSHDNPYVNIGCQDMTSHVDFTALQKAGEEEGLETLWFGEQYRFLMGLGFVEQLIALQARETDPLRAQQLRMTLKNLILPEGGMGETFKVLVQGKGIGRPELLCQRPIEAIRI
ncbi:SAM-dependent MidA family methyltransferase [Geothermobacter ehrlichii]|uniref:SAM-dependent MidA family methyltransferase n=1 Tax=Geothermobacter ehrlichii TaxID=213224 RepID=A0A5D3WHF9_9BACT|nr:SAM-dependent methyltransferase [Geothermobacter ehrlichii]TYO98289.1 SAM-dependent MidA family methyltransferase [Geothermobacter ehrlichii]